MAPLFSYITTVTFYCSGQEIHQSTIVLIYYYEVTDLSFVCFKGFGTAISSSAPLLGGTLTTGFGAPQGLGSSTFGQQPTTGTSFTKIKGVYYQPLTASVFWLIPVLALMRL